MPRQKVLFRKTIELDDAEFTARSFTWQQKFLANLETFQNFDPTLNTVFATNWLTKITAFKELDGDETMIAIQEVSTQDVLDQTELLLKKAAELEYFVKRAYPNDERMLQEFGFDKIRRPLNRGTNRIAIHALVLKAITEDYLPRLTVAGTPKTLLTEIETIVDELTKKEVIQEYTKRLRLRATTKRIRIFNELYIIHARVRDAARSAYNALPEKVSLFEV